MTIDDWFILFANKWRTGDYKFSMVGNEIRGVRAGCSWSSSLMGISIGGAWKACYKEAARLLPMDMLLAIRIERACCYEDMEPELRSRILETIGT